MTSSECISESIKARLLVVKDKLNLHGYNEKNIREKKDRYPIGLQCPDEPDTGASLQGKGSAQYPG